MARLSGDAFYRVILEGLVHYPEAALNAAFIADVAEATRRHRDPMLAHALNKNQMRSKAWLAEALRTVAGARLGTVYVVGGWFGLVASMLLDDPRLRVSRVLSIDLDPDCAPVAETLNRRHMASGRFAAVTADMLTMDYGRARFAVRNAAGAQEEIEAAPDTIINTSCEHIDPFSAWFERVPAGTLLALQSNDMFDEPVHVNCVRDLDEFRAQAPLSQVLYAGELALKRYTRFLLIGRK